MNKLFAFATALAMVGAYIVSAPSIVRAEVVASFESNDANLSDDISNGESRIKEDSLSISEEIKDNFRVYELYSDENTKPERRLVQDFESIMRWYNIPIRGAFTEYNNIDDVLVSKYVLRKYYVVEYKDGSIKFYNEQLDEMKSNRYTIIDGKEVLLPFSPISSKAFETFKNQDIMQNNLGSEVETESVFYMSGETSMMGTAIYYRTSIGDYVYYYHSSIGEKLFPVDDFCKFQQAIKDEYAKYPESGGGVDIANVWDLTKYELKYSSQETIKGDSNCDGSVDMADAVMIMQALANPNKYGIDGTAEHHLTEHGKLNGDMDGNGLTVGDAQAIQRILLGLTDN